MQTILDIIRNLPEYEGMYTAVTERKTPAMANGLSPIHRAHLAAALAADLHRPLVVVCADDRAAQEMARDLESFTERPVALLPFRDFVFHNIESSSREYEHRRIAVLNELAGGRKTVVMSADALCMATIPPALMKKAAFTIDFNGTYDTNKLTRQLVLAGYRRCMQVEGEGQFSLRGGILDIFATGEQAPVRIEFFGDEVDTMCYFDIGSQRRGQSVDQLVCLPNMEVLPTLAQGGIDGLTERLEQQISSRKKKHKDLERNLRRDVERMKNDGIFPAADKYLPEIYGELTTAC
ncbi:MAG: transcription-repair coupling factor, partial [Butyricicoccaceae bacterium]